MLNELLVPRSSISFKPLEEGRFIALSNNVPEMLKQPMVRSEGGSLKGYESGWRSGLLNIDNQLYKIKSCRPVGGRHGEQPRGSHTYSSAQFEADNTLERRDAFLRSGFDYPLEPIGFWVYDHMIFKGEPNAATIYRAKGDTRLDELLWWVEKSPYEYASSEYLELLTKIFPRLGYQTGRILKHFHENNFSWDSSPIIKASNAHSGNVIIFPTDSGKVGLGIIDFDISTSCLPGDPKELEETIKVIQKKDLDIFNAWMEKSEVVSRARRIRYCHEFVAGWIVDRMIRQIVPDLAWEECSETLGMAGAYLLRSLNHCEDLGSIRKEVIYSLEEGYKNEESENHELGIADDFSWEALVNLVKGIDKVKRDFTKRIKLEIGQGADKNRIDELAQLFSKAHLS